VIKIQHNNRPRPLFWQTPWAFRNNITGEWYEVGGFVNTAYHATNYASADEAENVIAIRGLPGTVEQLTA
jgi:hypothetical protein